MSALELACDTGLAAPLPAPPAVGGGAIVCAALTAVAWRWDEPHRAQGRRLGRSGPGEDEGGNRRAQLSLVGRAAPLQEALLLQAYCLGLCGVQGFNSALA